MLECRHLLENVSQERITAEFCKTLPGTNVKNTLLEFKDILGFLLPEIKDMIGFDQHNLYHVFFHDEGKPACYSLDEKAVGHFYGHPEISADMAGKILQRMRFSIAHSHAITELIKYHDHPLELNSKSVKKLMNKLGEVQFRRLLKVKRADILAQNPAFANERLKKLDILEGILNGILATNACITLRDLAVNGDDLILLGIPAGKQIGDVLNRLLEMVLNEETENSKDALLEKARAMIC